jgi:hypothetical protein
MLEESNLPTKPNICCGYPTDSGESLSSLMEEEEEETVNPRVGDLAVCLNCGAFLVYMNEQNDMRFARALDLADLSPENLKRFKKARKFIRQRGRFWPRKRAGQRFHPS